MEGLIRYNKYSRKDIHDIFSPDTKFTKGSGYWGISGIIKVPKTEKDFIFLVTYGQKQAEHKFDEDIDENGSYITCERGGTNTKEFYNNKNINFEGEIKKNTELGKKGEDIVVDYEKENLIKRGRKDLAEKVVATRKIAGNAERFDILSYNEDESEKYIEVKTTKGQLNNIFHISENEVKFSHDYGSKYYLYRVYNFNIKTMTADLKIIKGPVEREILQPTNYTCRIGVK